MDGDIDGEHDGGPTPEREVGVGPWPGGREAWPEDERYDPELLEHGDRRNVVDGYRYWRLEAIVADLDTRRAPLHVAIENLEHDANIGSIVRTANAYNVAGVHVVGRRRWNRRGAMVTDRYLHVHHHPDVAAFAAWAESEGVVVVGIDNVPGSTPIETFRLPMRTVLVFGSEGPGLSEEMQRACAEIRHITQHGSTRSINAGAAAAVAMFAWATQHLAR
ncbi:TrmH family RNA methyltransferase [Litorihabitans aurantiacus]|uniref:rRNA methyltransferase n=1 Tax=Litorihabitans aurantiacus TaxID=1930061 RepID=A0AA37UMW4_9MICO|nr:TrmH family RNA methyltransferase [Litorihabitans aurantiacus]GMA30128.1 rRNA methyltransferase [Litorihabitans aurantiacus]